ncbi:glycosyltransferase [Sphingomonas phyllosphaerae]|uniref:glycosyltransferase n=1 Tax=Sphingomonas phyllosphaerae TaxID=257003 RepID=UPI00241356F4|nr:glycosyltransferase [Sphingomonas phyllosphaerae]
MAGSVAYLINQYPKVSHSFIRTEVLALEAQGVAVERFAVRGWDSEIVDPLDQEELARTRYLLRGGAPPLVLAVVRAVVRRPRRFVTALKMAWQLSRGGERGFPLHMIYLAEACLLLQWIGALRHVTHVHAHFGSNAAVVAMLTRTLGGPSYSFTVHGPEEFDKPLQWKLREKIANAAFVVAITSYCRSQLYRWSAASDWAKIEVVHCAVDPRFTDVEITSPPATDTIVSIGRLCEQKGQLLLIESLAVLRERGVRPRLVLVGDGEMRSTIERAIAAARLEEQVVLAGWVDASGISSLLDGARALVLPSFGEGLPVAIMEAMTRGRPVLSTYIAGIPELVRDGVDGWLAPAGDVGTLADCIERIMLASPETLAELGSSARARVMARHVPLPEAAKLARLFRTAAEQTLASPTPTPLHNLVEEVAVARGHA